MAWLADDAAFKCPALRAAASACAWSSDRSGRARHRRPTERDGFAHRIGADQYQGITVQAYAGRLCAPGAGKPGNSHAKRFPADDYPDT
ncbi:MAG: hypothetical protein JO100_10335 [Pseudonocardia sp.]|nr:hypothetical protein [Pseudonocardia sp.]